MGGDPNELQKSLKKVLSDEKRIVIVLLIELFESLNLKMIALLLDKSEPPVLRMIKPMLDEGILIVDEETTKTSRGKYYALSPQTKQIFQIETFPRNKTYEDESEKQEEVAQAVNLMRSVGTLNHLLLKITANFFENFQDPDKLKHDIKTGEFTIFAAMNSIHLENTAEVKKFRRMFDDFFKSLKREFNFDELQKPTSHSHFFTISAIPIFKIIKMLKDMKIDWPRED